MSTGRQDSTVEDAVTLMAMAGSSSNTIGAQENVAQPTGFEGPEKRLEVQVRYDTDHPQGLLAAPKSSWEEVIGILNAKIVSEILNEDIHSYVLTESSLFVRRDRFILITCGTTTLLNSLPKALEVVAENGCEVEWASFMRKNFSYPWEQVGPHSSLKQEYTLLKSHLPLGRPHIFGPVDGDHYFFFVYDDIARDGLIPTVEDDTQVSMTMFDIDEDVSKTFFSDTFECTNDATVAIREKTNISKIAEGHQVNDLQFEPCGYSINTISPTGGIYQTMHVTPESHCSFASYETNMPVDAAGCFDRLKLVLSVFRPKRFTIIILADPQSKLAIDLETKKMDLRLKDIPGFTADTYTVNEFAPGYRIQKCSFVADNGK